FQWKHRAVADPRWNPGVARILAMVARRAPKLSVVPAYVEGSNSLLFQAAGMIHPRLRTLLLGSELLNKRHARVAVRIGSAIAAEKLLSIPTDEARADYMRWRTYLLAGREEFKPETSRPMPNRAAPRNQPMPIVDALPAAAMSGE